MFTSRDSAFRNLRRDRQTPVRIGWLYPTLWQLGLTLLLAVGCAFAQLHAGSSDTNDTFVLSGTVVNSVTGEGIARALVRVNGQVSRTGFSDSEGHFQFEGLPAEQVTLMAQKPGYYSEQDTTGYSVRAVVISRNTGSQTIKLQPMSSISGRVSDALGQSIERIPVRLTCRTLREGRRVWEARGMSETDEDGHFRFPSLMPATYYLSVGPAQFGTQILPAGDKPTTGFPHLYYPGVPDLSSAAPVQLNAGQQYQADFSLNPVPVYQVTGTILGQPSDRGVALMTFTPSGDELMLRARVNPEVNTFSLDSVPAGSYILKAMSNSEGQRLHAEQRISVAANVDNVHLAMAPVMPISVVVHLQSHSTSTGPSSSTGDVSHVGHVVASLHDGRPPLSVGLLPTQPNATESFSSFQHHGPGNNTLVIQNVNPGTYSVNFIPQQPWYVQSATYGQTNALYDDITVAAGQSVPLEVTLRDDGASLTVNVKNLGAADHPRADVLVLPQPVSKLAPHVLRGMTNSYTDMGLTPGEYLVFAFDHIDGLEYTNPDALSSYASQAAHVTLSAGQQGQVSVDLIEVGKGE